MIKYNLRCENKHEFESWFSDSNEFEKLKKNNLLECIYCYSTKVIKSIMSPRVVNHKETKHDFISIEDLRSKKEGLKKLKKFVENNFEFVGDKFASQVREIYYDTSRKKNIYGTTTLEERKELSDEGIELISIPWIEKEN